MAPAPQPSNPRRFFGNIRRRMSTASGDVPTVEQKAGPGGNDSGASAADEEEERPANEEANEETE